MNRTPSTEEKIDGVELAVINSRLQGIVRAMTNTLVRTGRSGVLNTARDFSCCLLTRDHDILAIAEGIPIHIMGGPDLMAQAMAEIHPELRRGDAFLHNSPYHGNSHAADFSILVPVIDDDGKHHFTVFAKAHQADCGNAQPTTYMADAKDVYAEGTLIFPCVKIQEEYVDRTDIIRMCELRIRVPEQWRGDHLALLGAARIGERRLLELGEEVTWDRLHSYTGQWFHYSEQRMIEAIRKFPSGRVVGHSSHDPIPIAPEGIPVKSVIDVDSENAQITVDLRENIDSLACGLNLSEASSRTAARIGVFNSLEPGIPVNEGSFRRINVQLRENCIVGIPIHPTSCSLSTTNVADRVANSIQRAMAEFGDGFGMAEVGLVIPPAWAVLSGLDPRADDAPFINQIILPAVTGGAGSPYSDGWLTAGHVGNMGISFRDSVELDEIHHPIRIVAQHLIPDSEGAGRFRGAPGAYVEYGPIESEIEVFYTSDGTVNPAEGAQGGLAGAPAGQYKRDESGELTELDGCGHVRLKPGETVVSMSCGGGGYGPPSERDRLLVQADVEEGWITPARASSVYGFKLDSQ